MPPVPYPQALSDLLAAYTDEVLAFSLSGPQPPELKSLSKPERANFIGRVARLAASSNADTILLLGLGQGDLATALRAALPETNLLVCEPCPQRLRAARAHSRFAEAAPPVLADASLRALWLLARGATAGRKFITCVNPELQGAEAGEARSLQRLLEFTPAPKKPEPTATRPGPAPCTLSLYVIAHPAEPDLAAFLAHVPNWVAETVIVWDAAAVPDATRALDQTCPAPVRHAARQLQNNFADQRNYALSLCAFSWVLSLDVDERLSPKAWADIRAEINAPRAAAYLLPRLTLYPDEDHFRMGYGLWPDPQLRLFARAQGLRYVNPVHEILTGFADCPALLPHCAITHLSYVLKNRATLTERLAVFNQAAGRDVHRLNETFPHLTLAWHEAWQGSISNLDFLPLLLKI